MSPAIKNFIRFELTSYHSNKQALSAFPNDQLISQRHLRWMSFVLRGIDDAMASFNEDLRRYVELRYFQGKVETNDIVTYKLNISERTVRSWDLRVLETVGRNIGVLNSVK